MQRASSRFDFARQAPQERACDHSGCTGEGLYRAPKSSHQLRDYHWFCLDHVREYNKSWNYCSGLSQAELEAMIRRDTTWERETRPMTGWMAHEQRLYAAAQAFAAGEARQAGAEWAKRKQEAREADTPEASALRVLGLTPPVDYAAIRARYIELVKLNHPDANGGDKASEELLKTINQALQTLKAAYLD
jgi:DnaJ-domain-containing protein 1